MYSIKLDVNDSIYDKVMFFLKNIPTSNLEVTKVADTKTTKKDDIVSFFQSSPLKDTIHLERETEVYNEKISF